MTATKSRTRSTNGTTPDPLAEAIAHEDAIADEATAIREEATTIDAALFLKLWPLLRRPIPAGFITTTGVVKGKPYPSTGVKSMQVLIDRMNNVLTPLWWWYEVEYFGAGSDAGTLAEVTVYVGERAGKPFILTQATSRGGVNQASTLGNRYKGSETNAAKRAFAQIGPGHEVYLGATDLDPDVSTDAAKAQEVSQGDGQAEAETLSADRAENLAAIIDAAGLTDHLPNKLRSFGKKALTDLTLDQGMALYAWTREAEAAMPNG